MSRGTSEARRGRLFAVEALAGWVFADILLVLFLVGMASARAEPQLEADPEPEPERVAEGEVSEEIVGMRPDPESFTISFDAAAVLVSDPAGPAAESVCESLRENSRALEGERAAFVLIFGGAEQPAMGQEIARRIEGQLECADPSLFPPDTVVRPYWSGGLPHGQASLDVFIYTTSVSDMADIDKE